MRQWEQANVEPPPEFDVSVGVLTEPKDLFEDYYVQRRTLERQQTKVRKTKRRGQLRSTSAQASGAVQPICRRSH